MQHDADMTNRLLLPKAAEATLWDIFPKRGSQSGATGLALTRLRRRDGAILWVQDWLSQVETGRPSLHGLRADLGLTQPVLRVAARRPVDVLWTMEEGLKCRALAGVIGEIWGDPKALDFTATKRLHLRAEANGIPVVLLRPGADRGLSAARERWQVEALPSAHNVLDAAAPGDGQWQLELFRSRSRAPATWEVRHDRQTHRLSHAAPLRDGALATPSAPDRHTATG